MINKLIAHLDATTSLFADGYNYILVLKDNPNQLVKNAQQHFFGTLAECFDEFFAHKLKSNLADDRDKNISEILDIINTTRREVKDLIRPFEDIRPS